MQGMQVNITGDSLPAFQKYMHGTIILHIYHKVCKPHVQPASCTGPMEKEYREYISALCSSVHAIHVMIGYLNIMYHKWRKQT